jgi:hypothetical protein
VADDPKRLRDLYSAKTRAPGAGKATLAVPRSASRARAKPRPPRPATNLGGEVARLGRIVSSTPAGFYSAATEGLPAVYDYFRTSTPGEVLSDVGSGLSSFRDYVVSDPGGAVADMVPVVGGAKAVREMMDAADEARAAGQPEVADKIESYTGPVALTGLIPEAGAVAGLSLRKGARNLAVRRAAEAAAPVDEVAASLAARPLALPAPPKVLALPAPPPRSTAKPRGGQFRPDVSLAARDAQAAGYSIRDRGEHAHPEARFQVVRPDGRAVSSYHASSPEKAFALADRHYRNNVAEGNLSPEAAAREVRGELLPDDPVLRGAVGYQPIAEDYLGDWLEKSLAKYYKTDFGTEADPLRDLAARGLHYDPEMTPERWAQTVDDSLYVDPIGYFTVPRHESEILAEHNPPTFSPDLAGDAAETAHHLAPGLSYFGSSDPVAQGALMQAAPWLRKQPATDMLYGIRPEMDLSHFTDEMRNAMDVAESGLPMDLAVRPESLQRMSFPQAVEHVGKINQYRVKQMEAERAAQLNNPAVQMFKEYPDDPRGMRWVELKAPARPEGHQYDPATGRIMTPEGPVSLRDDAGYASLQQALKHEGDTMGHCVGGYCNDVMNSRSRIFSLRDAKGMPHVTVETKPRSMVFSDLVAHLGGDEAAAEEYLTRGFQARQAGADNKSPLAYALELAQVPKGQDIVQIKGKQNRAPNAEYLPFVQDFVKSGQWGDVGDLGNTGLERLPDRRFITQAQLEEGVNKFYEQGGRRSPYYNQPENWVPEDWEQLKPYFEGYARGGLAVKKCGCMQCGGLAVRRKAT